MRPAAAFLIAIGAGSSVLWGTRCASFRTAPVPDEAGPVDAGAEGAPAPATVGSCPDSGGPNMVRIQTARGTFCIDVTEVTNGQYLTFLGRTENGAKATYPGPCPAAGDALPRDGTTSIELAKRPASLPVVFVDWCEAWAFCAWAGKRLCGELGGHGAPSSFVDSANVTNREWGVACSGEDSRSAFPYGSTFQAGRCNDGSFFTTAVPVGSLDCKSQYGVSDLSGNLTEWENACADDDAGASCLRRGGSFAWGITNQKPEGVFACDDALNGAGRLSADPDNGFRCCAD